MPDLARHVPTAHDGVAGPGRATPVDHRDLEPDRDRDDGRSAVLAVPVALVDRMRRRGIRIDAEGRRTYLL